MKAFLPTSLASLTTVGYLLSTVPVLAQIVPDNTLGPDSSRVTPRVIRGIPSDRIDGGLERGNNLFHSFEEFNVDVGRGAFFANPANIANILSRVTGENISNIFGTLGVLGDANLFLVNPNGIVFGPNARLDVSGSFFATTNNGFIFENGFEFVASNSDAPPLLTINIPIGLRLRENPGTIENQSRVFDSRSGDVAGLQVPSGQTLGFVGGEIIVNNGALTAPGGRLELAGVSGVGTIQLDTEENNINGLQISAPITRENIILTNGAILNVVDSNGGNIIIDGRNVEISQFSDLFAGIAPGEGTPQTQAGDIEINASEDFQLLNGSDINNRVAPDAQGNVGDTRITANNVFINGDARISSSSFGRGNAGNVIIRANERTSLDNISLIFSTIQEEAEGLGGNIRVTTGDLFISGGSQLQTLVEGTGDAGNIEITASGNVSLSGFPTAIRSSIEAGGIGKSGDINITTGSLAVSDGASLRASVRGPNNNNFDNMLPAGQGNAGIININATGRVTFDGVNSGAFSELELRPPDENQETLESGGNIQINAGSVFVTDGAELRVSTNRRGDAGKITINAQNLVSFDGFGEALNNEGNVIQVPSGAYSTVRDNGEGRSNGIEINTSSLRVTNGALLDVATFGNGDAGQVTINATDAVTFSNGATAFSTVEPGARGNSAGINIDARSLTVSNGAALTASVVSTEVEPNSFFAGQGQAGDININVTETISFNGAGSRAESILERRAVGGGGNIFINTGDLSVTNGALLDVATFGQGNAGNVIINAPNGSVTFDGASESGQLSSAFSTVELGAVGDGGNIEITTGSLSVTNGAQLRAETQGEGNADSIIINAPNGSVIFDGTTESGSPSRAVSVVTGSAVGDGGSIEITTGSLSVTNGALLDVATFGDGDAGSVIVQASGDVLFDSFFENEAGERFRSAAFSTVEANVDHPDNQGGNIEISARNLTVSNTAQLRAETERQGNAGNIIINTTENLFVTDNAALDVSTFNQGNAGDIIVEAQGNVLFDEATAFSTVARFAQGNSGNINITAGNLSVINGGQLRVEVEPSGTGKAGNIFVNAAGSVIFDGISESGRLSGAFSSLEEDAVGEAGSIEITANRLTVTNGAQLRVQTSGIGNAGSINILASDSVLFSGGTISNTLEVLPSGAFSNVDFSGIGNSGNITITTGSLNVLNGASLETAVESGEVFGRNANAGEIRIDTTRDVTFDGIGSVDSFQLTEDFEETVDLNTTTDLSRRSQAITRVESGVDGNSGNIIINAENLIVTNGAQLQASNSGVGIAGDIDINARNNVVFDGAGQNSRASRASTVIGLAGGGVGGNVDISAINLSVTNGAQLDASIDPFAIGFAGDVIVNTSGSTFFDGFFADETGSFPSGAFTIIGDRALGIGGEININAENLSVTNGAELQAQVIGQGDAGDVIINVGDSIFFDSGSAFTTVEQGAIGEGGNINITATNISLSNFGSLEAQTFGIGNAGNVFVSTDNLFAIERAQVIAQTQGRGNAGNIFIDASNSISIDDSEVFTNVETGGIGLGGNITINTGNLFVTNAGQLQAQTEGIGNAGNITINASDSVFFDGVSVEGFTSRASTNVAAEARGTGGDITINTQNFSVTNGATLSASLFNDGRGQAGTVTINAAERVYFDGGSSADSGTGIDAVGSGGQININTKNISFTNGAGLFTGTFGRGEPDNLTVAGNIIIQAQEDVYFDDSNAFSTVEPEAINAQGGTLYISADNLLVTNGAQLQASTRGQGDAGRVILEVRDSVTFEGFNLAGAPSGAFSSVAENAVGIGGNVVVRTGRLSIFDGAQLSAVNIDSNPENAAGNIWVDAEVINMDNAETIGVNNTARILTSTASGDGGDIGISARDIIMQNGSQIRTDAGQANLPGSGGDITINAELLVGLHRSHIAANAFEGSGGEMKLDNIDGRFGFEFYSRERLEKLFGAENLTEFKPENLPRSSITSISRTEPELSGTVELNEFDPTKGLIELPRIVVDPNDLINQDPCKQGQESELYIRGRGGIQVTPDDKLDGGEIEVDLVEPAPSRQRNRRNSNPDQSRTETEDNQQISSLDIIPARGWIRDENGDVILVDYDPTQTGVQRPQHRQQNPNICQPVSENPR